MRDVDATRGEDADRARGAAPEEDTGLIKAQVYKDLRPASSMDRYHARSRTREPDWVYEIVRLVTSLFGWVAFRVRSVAPENVPASGAVILAPNHFSFMDHFLVGVGLRRKVRFMAKSQLFKAPMDFIYTHGGVFPVRRGHRDEESFVTVNAILDRGGVLGMYCEGGRSRSGRLGERARPGIGRAALESGAVIVPTAIQGSAKVRNWRRGQFPKVTVLYGEPLRFERVSHPTRDQQQAVADAIFDEIKALYARLGELGRDGALALERERRRSRKAGAPPR
jgi:1-acyl-sn-glycerol-3-phosphate acyltransferase